jgi:hypothetical protein
MAVLVEVEWVAVHTLARDAFYVVTSSTVGLL